MPKNNQQKLSTLYNAQDINTLWDKHQHWKVINHPKYGQISPHSYRAMFEGKPCPFCGQKMKYGAGNRTTKKSVAISLGFQYLDKHGNKIINKAGHTYFHPHYVTLDHKINKARCPERMFDSDNLQAICWKCNKAKGDNNAYCLRHTLSYIDDLAQETLKRYPLL